MQKKNNEIDPNSYTDLEGKIQKAYHLTRHLKAIMLILSSQ